LAKLQWWQKAVFYQIYPRSFADGNGDGIGDLRGMIDHLDYLERLGIDALWISPHYPSPQFDVGYDVADYTGVNPEYGTLEDFKEFLEGAHQRGMRVILDFVPNHSSDQHPWFRESRSSRENRRRDWYIWRDGKDGGPPNNWSSTFGGPAWEYDATTDQYYYHFFFKEQPDLNWRNPELKQAMWQAVRFWLKLGVDGFRLDAIGTIYEDSNLPDHPGDETLLELYQAELAAVTEEEHAQAREKFESLFQYQVEQPEVLDLMKELRRVVDEYPDRMLVGETDLIRYYGDGTDGLHLVFNFPLMETERLTPAWVRSNQKARLTALPVMAWPCNTLGNHDSPRVLSRFGGDKNDTRQARLYLALMLTLRGTPFLYNGEEIGMTDLTLTDASAFRDNVSTWIYQTITEQLGMPAEGSVALAAQFGRDKCRTPMQWENAPNAGFSPAGVQTWLPVNPNYAQGVNVAEQESQPDSLLNFYRRMLHLRRQTPALIAGDYTPLLEGSEHILAFLRRSEADRQTCLVALNMSDQEHTLNLTNEGLPSQARCLFSSRARGGELDDLSELVIAPFEIYIGTIS
jgi:alpha-glucosidase